MTDFGEKFAHADGHLGQAEAVLEEVERGLAKAQRDEVVAMRTGEVMLLLALMAVVGSVVLGFTVLLVRQWLRRNVRSDLGLYSHLAPVGGLPVAHFPRSHWSGGSVY